DRRQVGIARQLQQRIVQRFAQLRLGIVAAGKQLAGIHPQSLEELILAGPHGAYGGIARGPAVPIENVAAVSRAVALFERASLHVPERVLARIAALEEPTAVQTPEPLVGLEAEVRRGIERRIELYWHA